MIKSYIKILIFIIFPLIFHHPFAYADAELIFERNSKAVVVVIAYDEVGNPISQGSGFIVRSDGRVVTNYHVISNAKNIKVMSGSKTLSLEGIVHIDKENDIAILKIKGKDLPTVKLGDAEKAKVGEKIYVISSPEGFENTLSEGIISGIREIAPKRKIIQITAPVSSGSSGGPLFNKAGEVIGVVSFIIKEAQNLNFAIPVNPLKDKIGKKVTPIKETEDYKQSAYYWVLLGYYYGQACTERQ